MNIQTKRQIIILSLFLFLVAFIIFGYFIVRKQNTEDDSKKENKDKKNNKGKKPVEKEETGTSIEPKKIQKLENMLPQEVIAQLEDNRIDVDCVQRNSHYLFKNDLFFIYHLLICENIFILNGTKHTYYAR